MAFNAGEKDEFDNCGTDFHYMFGQVDTWESVTNSDWLMYDTSGASVMGSSAVKLQTHKTSSEKLQEEQQLLRFGRLYDELSDELEQQALDICIARYQYPHYYH